jgi:hypothetical protein
MFIGSLRLHISDGTKASTFGLHRWRRQRRHDALVGRQAHRDRTSCVALGGGDWTRFLDGRPAGTGNEPAASFRGEGPWARFFAGRHAETEPGTTSRGGGAWTRFLAGTQYQGTESAGGGGGGA